MKVLTELYREMEVGYCRLVTISTDTLTETNEYRSGVGAHWPFLSDAGRVVQKDLDIAEYTDPLHNPMIPHVVVLEAGALHPQSLLRILVLWKANHGGIAPRFASRQQEVQAGLGHHDTRNEAGVWQDGRKDQFYPYGQDIHPDDPREGVISAPPRKLVKPQWIDPKENISS